MTTFALIMRYDPFRTSHGTEIFGKNLAMALASAGHEVDLIFGSTPAPLAQAQSHPRNPRVHSHLVSGRTSQAAREVEYLVRTRYRLRRMLHDISPDVVIGVGAGQGSIFSEMKQRSARCVLAYYAIDCMAQEGRAVATLLKKEGASLRERIYSRARYFWLERMDMRSCKNAELIIATSRDTKMNLSKYYKVSPDKVTVNYLGIPDDYAEGLLSSYPEIPTFLHIATRHERKGTRYLLDALRILKRSKSGPVRAIIRGSADPYYVSLANGLDVEFVTHGDVKPLYCSCTALVVPSVAEGFCLPVVEAAALGKPAIVSSAGSLPELVSNGENGFVVPVGDGEMLAQRMRVFCENPALVEKMGKRAQDISRGFRITNSTRNLLRIIETHS